MVEGPLWWGFTVFKFDSTIKLSMVWWELLDFDRIENIEIIVPFLQDKVGKVVRLDVKRTWGYGSGDSGFGGDMSHLTSIELLREDTIAGRVLRMVGEDSRLVVLRILAETSQIDKLDVEWRARRWRIGWSGERTRWR